MKQGGKGTIAVVVVLILVAALAALFGYSKLKEGNDGNIDLEGKIAGISEEQGTVGLVSEDGTFAELPGNARIVGINKTGMDLVSEFLKGDTQDPGQPDNSDVTPEPEDTPIVTDEPEITGEPEDENVEKDFEDILDESFASLELQLKYIKNKEDYDRLLGFDEDKSGSGEVDPDNPEDEPIEFLAVYNQGTDDKSVALIQERLMQLGFMEFAEPTEHYGPITMESVKLFQRQNDLKQDGIIGEQTIALLFDDNAKSYLLKKGMDGEDIRSVQLRLYELGYLASKDQLTGHFGDDTDAAVKALQKANGLTADGKIGVMTNELLYSENVKANIVSFGDKSDVILECQNRLKELGYLTTKPDGYYGEDTLAAVKLFQSRNDCIVDGYLGPSTRAKLISNEAKPNGLVIGDSNDTVKKVQQLLIKYGYLASGSDTGYFGDLTDAAVKNFQKRNGLVADGNVGQKTMNVLTGNNVVKASSGGSGGNGGNGGSGGDSGGTVSYSCSPDDLIKVAKSKLGCKYVWGSKGPNTFDCSGFVYWCLNQIGVKQSYLTSYAWRTVGKYKKITDFDSIKKGDIIVVYGHVGIAAGGGDVIDASSSNGKIVYRTMGDWWKRNFICAWRIFD